jgi:calcineurin-like phosphoesterase family protein
MGRFGFSIETRTPLATYFSSDPHFGHGNIMRYCRRLKFMTDADREAVLAAGDDENRMRRVRMSPESVQRMDDGLIDNTNAVVGADDTLYLLGDFCAWNHRNTNAYLEKASAYRDRIKCKNIWLIWGNHDTRVNEEDGPTSPPMIAKLFTGHFSQGMIRADGYKFWLNHYPMLAWDGDHKAKGTDRRSPVYHLFGHVHSQYSGSQWTPTSFPDSWAAMDVGVDVEERYAPWSAQEIVDRLWEKAYARSHFSKVA